MNGVGCKLYVMGGYQKVSEQEVTHSPSEVCVNFIMLNCKMKSTVVSVIYRQI